MTDLTAWWDDVRTTALLGTSRRPAPPLPAPVEALPGSTPEEALLDALALGIAWTAGATPDRPGGDLPPAAEPEPLPYAPPAAERLLETALALPAAERPRVVAAWARACADAGYVVRPGAALVGMLDVGAQVSDTREPIRAAMGTRGRWLAGQRGKWSALRQEAEKSSLAGIPDVASFVALPKPRRLSLIAQLETDAWQDPARARSAEALAVLEAALDDPEPQVRQGARNALERLPDSAFGERMAARLRGLVHLRKRLLRKAELVIDLPQGPLDEAGRRDGLDPAPESWRRLVVRAAPLATWTAATGLAPEEIVAAVDPDFIRLLELAALNQRDAAWALALLPRITPTAPLLLAMPAAQREQVMAARLAGRTDRELAKALVEMPGPWSRDFTATALAALTTHAGSSELGGVHRRLALVVRPADRDLVESLLPALSANPDAHADVASSLSELTQLHSIQEAFA